MELLKMMKEMQLEDSPFFVDYIESSGNKKEDEQVLVRLRPTMYKALEKYFEGKYADEIKEDGFKYARYVRYLLEDYIQHQCIDWMATQYSIIGVLNYNGVEESHFQEGYQKVKITPLFVHKISEMYERTFPFKPYYVNKFSFSEYEDQSLQLTEKEQKSIEYYQFNNEDYNNKLLVEIPLNNFLDKVDHGIYHSGNDVTSHRGVCILPTHNGSYGVDCFWKYTKDDGIDIVKCRVINQRDLLKWLLDCQNLQIHNNYRNILNEDNESHPKHIIELLEDDLQRYENKKKSIDWQIHIIQSKLDKEYEKLKKE